MNIQDIIKDPDYLGLPDTEKIKVINYILQKDDDFNGLPEEEKGKVRQYFIQRISGQPKAITRKFAEWKYSGIEKIEKQPVEQPAEQPEKQEHFIKTFTKEVVKPSIPEEEMPKWEQLARQEAKALLNITPYFLSFGATAPIQAGVRAGLIARGMPTLARFAAPITHYATAFGIADAMKSLVKSMVSGDGPEGSVEKAGKEFVKGAVSSVPFGIASGTVSNVARPLITSTKAIIDNLIEDGKIKKEELPNIALGMGIYASMSLLMDKTIPAMLKQRAKADLAKEISEAIRRYNPSISQQEADLLGQMAARKIELEALYRNKPPLKTLEEALVYFQKYNPQVNLNIPQITSGFDKASEVVSQLALPPETTPQITSGFDKASEVVSQLALPPETTPPIIEAPKIPIPPTTPVVMKSIPLTGGISTPPATTPIETPKIPIPPTTLPETQPIPLSGRPLTEAEQKQIDLQNKLKEIDKQFENKQKKLNKYSLWAYAKGKISPESVEALGYKIKDLEEEGIPRLFWKKGGAGLDKWIQENRYLITGSEGDTDEVKLVDNFISSLIQERHGKIVSIPHVEAFIDLQTEKEALKDEIRRQYGQEAEAIIPEIEKEVDNIPNNEIVAITNEPTEEDIKAVANELTDTEIAFIKNALANNQEVPPIFRKALEVREQLTPAPEQVQERAITQPVEPKKRGRPKKTQPPITEQPAPPIEQEVKQPETPPISPETQKEIADYSDYIQQKYKLSPELSEQVATEYITKDKKDWSKLTRKISYKEEELMRRDMWKITHEGYIPTEEDVDVYNEQFGGVYIPSFSDIKTIKYKILSHFDIEAPFKRMGTPETGFRIKNYYSEINTHHTKGIDFIKKISKTPLPQNVNYSDLTFISEQPTLLNNLPQQDREVILPTYKKIREFFDDYYRELQKMGWLEDPFPETLLRRRTEQIYALEQSLKYADEKDIPKIKEEIKKYQDQVDRIREQKIQFVSIPVKEIMAKLEENPDTFEKVMSILPHWGRETLTVKDLVDAGLLTEEEADIRRIIGEYVDRMGRKLAIAKIFQSAEKEGLVKSITEAPKNWVKFNARTIPQLRGKRLHPVFSDMLERFFPQGDRLRINNVLGSIKLLQFYNPLFLPMNDLWQSAATGALTNIKTPKYIVNGIRDVMKKTPTYWTASENGLFSQPYDIPYNEYSKQIQEIIKNTKATDIINKYFTIQKWLPTIYQISWNTAWEMDKITRMITYNYLLAKGFSPRDAAQTAALYHSDYASVPPETRKILNKIFFTPTFRITMIKLYNEILKASGKVVIKYPAKLFGVKVDVSPREAIAARGLLLLLGFLAGLDLYMKHMGFEQIEVFRKHKKRIETEEGEKEMVITFANPFNIPWRYYYRIKGSFTPQTLNRAERLLNTLKWDIHPLYRVAYEIVFNQGSDYKPVYNPFDDTGKQIIDITKYTTGELLAITKGFVETERGREGRNAFRMLQKDIGKFRATVFKPFVFSYLRNVEERRKAMAIRSLEKELQRFMNYASDDLEEQQNMLDNFSNKLQQILEELE